MFGTVIKYKNFPIRLGKTCSYSKYALMLNIFFSVWCLGTGTRAILAFMKVSNSFVQRFMRTGGLIF